MNLTRGLFTNCLKTYSNFCSLVVLRNCSNANLEFQEKKIKVIDYEINYLKTGSGPHNLVLMPGALGSIWSDFGPQIKGFDKNLFTIVAWDPPGYGKSIPPYREFPLDFLEKDADTALHLMRALNLKKFSLLGWSDGGISSLFLAAKYPEYVRKMVIWGANSFVKRTELAAYESIRDVTKWSKRMRDPLIALYGESYFAETWGKWCDALQNIYNENKGDICMSKLQLVKCPSFVLYGSKDAMVHPEHFSILHSNIANAESYIYPEGGHNIHLKYAEDFQKRVTEFLTK